MATLLEFAALSAYIYNDQRGGGGASEELRPNLIGIPPGWIELGPQNGFSEQVAYNGNFFSFTAGAFLNQVTGEIVISYKGTDFLLELAGRAWNTAGDMVTDLAAGIGGKLTIPQFVQSATYFQDVKAWAVANGHDPNRISFTGHSLGGGIASVMSAW
jgi:hypothetical protein